MFSCSCTFQHLLNNTKQLKDHVKTKLTRRVEDHVVGAVPRLRAMSPALQSTCARGPRALIRAPG